MAKLSKPQREKLQSLKRENTNGKAKQTTKRKTTRQSYA